MNIVRLFTGSKWNERAPQRVESTARVKALRLSLISECREV
jgi:hypothetical protein